MRSIIRWLPPVCWMIVIYYLSAQTGSHLNAYLPFFKKWFPYMEGFNWAHFVAYFILALAFYWPIGRVHPNMKGKILVVVLCILYGMTDEYHQSFVKDRTPDIQDLLHDTIGAMLAMLVISIPLVNRQYAKWVNAKKY